MVIPPVSVSIAPAGAQFPDEVGSPYAAQGLLDVAPFFGFVPEEKLSLGKFFFRRFGAEDRLERIRVIPSVPCLGAHRHRCRCEVLHLFKVEIQAFGEHGQFSHILLMAAWMAADEVRNDLLFQILLTVDAVKNALEIIKLIEGRFSHQSQHLVAGMLGCHL